MGGNVSVQNAEVNINAANHMNIYVNQPVDHSEEAESYFQKGLNASSNCHRNMREAFTCFLQAVDFGHEDAKAYLASCYAKGSGCERDIAKAASYGNITATRLLGDPSYRDCDKDRIRTLWSSADSGNIEAVIHLGLIYREGILVDRDEMEAQRLFQMGMKNLSQRYDRSFEYSLNRSARTLFIKARYNRYGDVILSSLGNFDSFCYENVIILNYVTIIEDSLFSKHNNIKRVSLPPSIKTIGKCAFKACTGLINVNIPQDTLTINTSAFEDCSNLKSIELPDSITKLGKHAFRGCIGLESIRLPNNHIKINNGTFKGCVNLKKIFIPEKVSSIGFGISNGCRNVTEISLPKDLRMYAIFLPFRPLTFRP